MDQKEKIKIFRKTILGYYRRHGRCLPWRETGDPYKILISEIMLQQTQVPRVIPFYKVFIKQFPNFATLAGASDRKILKAWQGLGYNRRALSLKKTARIVLREYRGKLPSDEQMLQELPGVGAGTAGALLAFAFNVPTVFIETNIRRVFIHFFFPFETKISDEKIFPLIKASLDKKNPRRWYSALMDYGAYLALTEENANHQSKHYVRQPKFEGSRRQLRGRVLKLVLQKSKITNQEIAEILEKNPVEIKVIRTELKREGFSV